MTGPDGNKEPIMVYDAQFKPDTRAADFVQQKMARRNYPYGTQSVRMSTHAYENWGSCVYVFTNWPPTKMCTLLYKAMVCPTA